MIVGMYLLRPQFICGFLLIFRVSAHDLAAANTRRIFEEKYEVQFISDYLMC